MKNFITDPKKIQEKSFSLIEEILGDMGLPPAEKNLVYRLVHATGDFDIPTATVISSKAVKAGRKALRSGARIITDVNMLKAGISRKKQEEWGYRINCFISEPEIKEMAEEEEITRSMASVRKAAQLEGEKIYVIGNAPTALVELLRLVEEKKARPSLIIGVPVGLVGAQEIKRELEEVDIPHITIRGKKGGTAAAASLTNALIYG